MNTSDIARICHQTNRAYCQSIGDDSQKDWKDAEQWQRDSAVKGVEFRIENPKAGALEQHESWREDKIKDGWIYGEKKDPEKKEHPCLVPYNELPYEQRIKDQLFAGICDVLIPMLD